MASWLSMNAGRYYRHSGNFPPLSLAKALGFGFLVSVPMAFIYAYSIVYIPIIGVVTFVLTGGFAVAIGVTVGGALHAGKVRNNVVAAVTAIPVALFALWASWVVWVYALLQRADAKVGLLDLAGSPAGLWEVINLINEKGAWSFKGATPTGGLLWAMWAGEATIITGIIIALAVSMVGSPFCENCDRWCEEHKAIALLGPTSKEELSSRLEQGDYTVLKDLKGATSLAFTQIDLHQCNQCLTTAALTATAVTVTTKNGKHEKHETTLLRHLVLTPGDLATVKTILAETPALAA